MKAVPLALAALGIGAATVLTGGAFWPFALAWIAAAACVLFTFEGGLLLLPAAIASALVR